MALHGLMPEIYAGHELEIDDWSRNDQMPKIFIQYFFCQPLLSLGNRLFLLLQVGNLNIVEQTPSDDSKLPDLNQKETPSTNGEELRRSKSRKNPD